MWGEFRHQKKGCFSQTSYRLIDMGNYQESTVHIIDLDDYDGDFIVGSKYAALSYCWDGQGSFRLQTSSLSSFTKDIRVDQLLRTFQDTIQVCKYLKI